MTTLSLSLSFSGKINNGVVTRLLKQVPHIQQLHLNGDLCYFNLDNFVNLRKLSLYGIINKNFNFELLKNLSSQLEDITIGFTNIDEEKFFKLFNGYKFPYLEDFTIEYLYINRLKKEFIDRLPIHKRLSTSECYIRTVENDSFSNMQQLISLDLSRNRIELIEENTFINLKNLQKLDLSHNRLTKFDRNFIGLGNSVEVNIKKKTILIAEF